MIILLMITYARSCFKLGLIQRNRLDIIAISISECRHVRSLLAVIHVSLRVQDAVTRWPLMHLVLHTVIVLAT